MRQPFWEKAYSDWETLLRKSYVIEDQHPGSPPHTHPINKLVARKPMDETGGAEST